MFSISSFCFVLKFEKAKALNAKGSHGSLEKSIGKKCIFP